RMGWVPAWLRGWLSGRSDVCLIVQRGDREATTVQTTPGPLGRFVVNRRSPDRNIHGTFRGRHGIELRFAHGAYFRYDDASLAAQLGPLATTTWAEYRRAYFAALSEELGRAVRPEDRSDSSRLNEYRQELAQLKLSGD